MQRHRLQMSYGECCTVGKKMVELAAITAEIRTSVENVAEGVLHAGDVCADGKLSAHLLLQPRRSRQMVGVCMCFEQPLHLQAIVTHVLHQCRSGAGCRSAGSHVEVENGVDDGAGRRARISDHMAGGKGRRVEERLHLWRGRAAGVGVADDGASRVQ